MRGWFRLPFLILLFGAAWMTAQSAQANGVDDAKAGEIAKVRGRDEEAIRLFTRALRSGELSTNNQAVTLDNRATVYAHKRQFDLAIADFNESIRLRPNAVVYRNRALTYSKMHRYDQAVADFDAAIRLKPEFSSAYRERGAVHGLKHEYEKAIADFTHAIRLNPNDADAYHFRGVARSRSGQYDQALNDYREAIRLKPDFPEAYWSRGFHYFVLDKLSQAEQDFEWASKLGSSDAYKWLWLHVVRGKLGHAEGDELKASTSKLDLVKWPGPVVALYTGQGSIEKIRTAASNGDAYTVHDRGCEADFFIAEYEMARKHSAEATSLLQHVVSSCQDTLSAIGAAAELKRLQKKTTASG